MNNIIRHSLFITIFAILFSMLEIEIEGETGGWAKNIPTSQSNIGIFTNYHIIMNIMIILVVGYSTLIINNNIYIAIYFIIAWFAIEDFCWFVLNPYFTLKKYTKEDIWWHSNQPWIYNIPFHNIISLALILTLIIINGDIALFYSFILMIVLVYITILLSPYYHKWYMKRKNKSII